VVVVVVVVVVMVAVALVVVCIPASSTRPSYADVLFEKY